MHHVFWTVPKSRDQAERECVEKYLQPMIDAAYERFIAKYGTHLELSISDDALSR